MLFHQIRLLLHKILAAIKKIILQELKKDIFNNITNTESSVSSEISAMQSGLDNEKDSIRKQT